MATKGQVLVTGGAGYIGSHTVLELLEAGYGVTVVDSLVNASEESLKRVEALSGKKVTFFKVDLLDREALERIFAENKFELVIHFAGLKAVGESTQKPLYYYHNNITGTLVLLELMQKYECRRLIFSSSATVYGDPAKNPIEETQEVGKCTNPYGKTKYFIEEILRDLCKSDPTFTAVILRYFNPIGAHKSGRIGEDPAGIPNNLLPYVTQVAVGKREKVSVFGSDYDTPDGTGVRDYIHVVDLALGHVAAIKRVVGEPGCVEYNLGSGSGCSVLEVIKAVEVACGKEIPYAMAPRRAGDIATCYADPSKALKELGWKTMRSLEEACADAWRWQSQNPNGYSA